MRGSADDQVRLVLALEAYQLAEFSAQALAGFFPDLQRAADRLHTDLFVAACFCGFEPAGFHKDKPLVEWAVCWAAKVRRDLPNHVAEATANRKEA